MANPDGVYFGYNRTDTSGNDLNRVWEDPDENEHPVIYALKSYITKINETNIIELFVDLHGHSKNLNFFLYGCESNPISDRKIKEFIKLFSKANPYCSVGQSSLFISKKKDGTARVALNRQLRIEKSFTLEASMFGTDRIKSNPMAMQFSILDYKQIGIDLLRTLAAYSLKIKSQIIDSLNTTAINNAIESNICNSRASPIEYALHVKTSERSRAVGLLDKERSELTTSNKCYINAMALPKLHNNAIKSPSNSNLHHAKNSPSVISTTKNRKASLHKTFKSTKISLKSIEFEIKRCSLMEPKDINSLIRPFLARPLNNPKYLKGVKLKESKTSSKLANISSERVIAGIIMKSSHNKRISPAIQNIVLTK